MISISAGQKQVNNERNREIGIKTQEIQGKINSDECKHTTKYRKNSISAA